MDLMQRNVILRIVKPYPEARNHIYTGTVVACTDTFVGIHGIVYHFGKPTAEDSSGNLKTSALAVRWVPYQRIEYIRELPEGMDPHDPNSMTVTEEGNVQYPAAERPDLLPD